MSKYTFKQFQAEYPDDAACLRAIMFEQYGGTEFPCPACGTDSKFHPMGKRRAFACQNCGCPSSPSSATSSGSGA